MTYSSPSAFHADSSHLDGIATKNLVGHSWTFQDLRTWFEQPRGSNGRYGQKPRINQIAACIFTSLVFVATVYHWVVFKITYGF